MVRNYVSDTMDFNDWDFDDAAMIWGQEYLDDTDNDSTPFPMSELDEIVQAESAIDLLNKAFYGSRWGYQNDSFNPNDDYFTFDGYANLISIPYLEDYLTDIIDESEFKQWCIDNGYVVKDNNDESDE